MSFTSHKKLHLHCLAKLELKPHTKVLKILFHNKEISHKISMWLLYILYSNFHKKTGIWFSWKKFLQKCLFKIPLWREVDNITSYFLISSKNLKWKQHFHTDRFGNYQLLYMAVWWGLISRSGRDRGKGYWWAALSNKPPFMRCGETYSAWE